VTDFERIHRRYAARGIATIEGFDRDRMLSVIREQRRRHAHQPEYASLGDLAQLLHKVMQEDEGLTLDNAAGSDTLLAVSSLIGVFVAEGMHATAMLNVLAYIADDLAKEAGR
jgi:hypothetical protein